jgi:hypothetical protein
MSVEDELCIRVLVPAGVLGWGVSADELEAGLALKPHAIALDAGSTDSGPAYLATAGPNTVVSRSSATCRY